VPAGLLAAGRHSRPYLQDLTTATGQLAQVDRLQVKIVFWELFHPETGYLGGCSFPGLTKKRRPSLFKEVKRIVVERSAFDEAFRVTIIRACSSGHATETSRENVSRIGRWSSPIERNVGRDSGRLLGLASSRNPNAWASSERRKARTSRSIRNCNSSIIKTNFSRSGSRSTRRMFVSKINSSSAERGWHGS